MLTHLNSTPKAPSRVVVLGAHGFVAARLVRALDSQEIARRPVGSAEVDLVAPDAAVKLHGVMRPDDAVVVTSALTPDRGRDRSMFLKNVAMIDHLCDCLALGSCAHLVYVSSDSVYDSRFTQINEETCCQANDFYALAHIVREQLLIDACQKTSVPLAIVRPCAIYGAGDTHDSYGPNRFMRTARGQGRITLFGHGEERRDHIYIDDVAQIILACLLHRSTGIVNAVSGRAFTFREVADKIVSAVGRPVSIETIPRHVSIVHKCFDPAALCQAFPGFVPTSLDDGIRNSLDQLAGVQTALTS